MAAVRLTPKQARRYAFTGEQKPEAKPQKTAPKPMQSHEVTRTEEKALPVVIPAIGQRWRVAKGLRDHFCTPPPVGTVLTIWRIASVPLDSNRIYLEGEGFSLPVTTYVLGRYFEQEEAETC